MPGKIKVKVLAGRNLPVMDRASDTTDAFVEIKFGSITHKTDVCRKSLNPHWNNTEWYRFEVDESELQDEPLQLRLMDHDTYSANDAIGKVVISLAPLLAREANNAKSTAAPHGGAVMSGWIPVFDTMHGIRGELNVIVKVELFSDFNKYKTSSCGVQFFHCPMIPPGYRATSIHGFVEELVVNDDPEYQWIDKIRTPRASNEARQVAFIKLSNQVQRLVGLKAAELGANAVVGYQQDFDLEGEAGVVARAIGTAVSITPLPMPSQTLNMPPCTQQQLKKYLDILATDNESISEMSTYYQCHQEELQNLLLILNPNASSLLDETDALEEDEKSMDMTRQSSITSYAGSASIYQDDYPHRRSLRHISEDQTDLNRLLNKESDDSDSSGPIEKLKKIKTNFFTKRFTRRSSSKRSSIDKQDDSISLRSNVSDTSRISLVDIKNEFKKFKGLRKPKFRKPFVNKEAEGEGMASILARSIIHVQTSLACIAETQDSEASPGSTMRRTSECEPTVNMSDDDTAKTDSEEAKKIPEIRYTSLNNISTEEIHVPPRERKISESCPATPMPDRSENLLTLPGDVGYFGSVSSALSADSSELESSSEEEDDDESSDLKTDNERSIETTSSVVQSVLSHDLNPQFIASMDKKLNVLESGSPVLKEVKPMDIKKEIDKKAVVEQQVFDTQVLIDKCKSLECVPREMESKIVIEKPVRSNEASTSSVKDDTCVTKPSSHHIKFHNPFSHKKPAKSISEPSSPVDKGSFVHRSSRRIRRQLSKLSKSNMIKSISHYSLHPKKKETKTPLSQPGSSSDIHSKAPSETVLGSPFLSFNDLMSLDKESIDTNKFFHKSDDLDHAKVSMYIGSEPVSRCSLSGISSPYHREEPHHHEKKHSIKSTGLVHAAMETILLDKVQSLLMPASPDPDSVKNKQFFNDVNEKLGLVEEYRNNNNNASVGSSINLMPSYRPESQSPPVSNKPVVVSGIRKEKIHEHKSKPPSLMQTAMETMLMDQVQSVLMSTTPETSQHEFRFEGNELPEPHEQHKNMARKSISYIQSLLGPKSPDHTSPTERFFDSKKKKEAMSTGLVHTAMETMLMEKVQSVLGPETPEPVSSVFDYYDRPEEYDHHHKKDDKSHSLFQTAIETMLLEKVQASALGGSVPDPVISTEEEKYHELHKSDSSTGMTHSAMETMLMDRVTTLVGQSDVPHVNPHHFDEEEHDKKSIKDDLKPTGLVHTAFETMLLEKLQASALGGSVPDPVISTEEEKYNELHKTDSSTGMTHSAMETMLMDRVTTLVGQSDVPHVNPHNFDDDEHDKKSIKDDLKPTGLVHTAFETMLLEKVQASALGGSVPNPIISTDEEKYHDLHKTDSSTGMTHTAMETMLMDRVTTLVGQSDVPHVNPHNFDDDEHDKKSIKDDLKPTGLVHTAFETMLLEKVQASALGGSVPNPIVSTDEEKYHDLHKTDSSTGMTHTAMETMLMDRITSLVGQSDLPHVNPHNFDEDELEKHDKKSIKDDLKPTGLVHTAFETMLLEKVQAAALGGSVPDPVISTDEERYHELHKTDSSTGMTHTAMETMLMDKITSLVGEPEVLQVEPHHFTEKESEQRAKKSINDDLKPTGLIHTALETIILDKVQASSLGTPVPVVSTEDDHHLKSHEKEEGLTHTAMETILMDKVQSLVGQQRITFVEPKTFSEDELEEAEHLNDDLKSPGLVKSAVKNILLDKVNTLAAGKEKAVEKLKEIFDKSHSTENLKSSGIVHTAFETVVLEKEQTLIPPETTDTKKKVEDVVQDEPPGIISTVIDKIQSLLPTIEIGTTEETKTIEKPEAKPKNKKLTRQDSVHSITENETPKMSKKSNKSSSDFTKPVLLIHGALETIPSLPETQDDVDETNNSVCDNSHAVCGVNRNERERDRREDKCDKDKGSPRHARHESYGGREPVQTAHAQNSSLNATSAPLGIHRRSSDSDLSVTPKGGSLNTSAGNVGSGGGAILRPSMNSNNLDMLEYPFLTMTEYAPGFIVHIGGTVCARSVKLADGGEGAARAAWWAELRTELRAHARALRCNAVIAYTENTAICEDVCVLSASGTAAVINLDCDFNAELEPSTATTGSKNAIDDLESELCSMAHVPYSPGAGPYRAELSTCGGCRRARVPTVLLATCSKPSKLTSHAKAVTLTAVAARVRRAPPTSEPGARDISDQLPFLEYELHKLLLAKLRMQGANALFSLQTQISIGERCVMALASGTACRLGALPPPAPPRIKASENDKDALEIQKALWDSFSANRAANGFDIGGIEHATNGVLPEVDGEEAPVLDLCADKDACVLELDEAEDVETARALAKRHVNMQVYTHGLKPVMGAQPQAFAQVWRGRLSLSGGAGSAAVERHVRRALAGCAYKLRRLQPCALVAPRFQLELPEDEIQLIVSGSAIPLQDPNTPEVNGVENGSHSSSQHSSQQSSHTSSHTSTGSSQCSQAHGNGDADDDIFTLDEEQLVKSPPEVVEEKSFVNGQVPTTVSLTTLSHISGGRVSRRLCALRLLFVRETTAVRELGGLSGFLHTFTCEVMAIVRAYTAALGGNALTSFYITQLMLQDNAHKNQGQCLLSVGGDIVHITY